MAGTGCLNAVDIKEPCGTADVTNQGHEPFGASAVRNGYGGRWVAPFGFVAAAQRAACGGVAANPVKGFLLLCGGAGLYLGYVHRMCVLEEDHGCRLVEGETKDQGPDTQRARPLRPGWLHPCRGLRRGNADAEAGPAPHPVCLCLHYRIGTYRPHQWELYTIGNRSRCGGPT